LLASDYKSYWKLHDEIIELMVSNINSTRKVRMLIKAFDKLGVGCDLTTLTPDWIINETQSNTDTKVLMLNI